MPESDINWDFPLEQSAEGTILLRTQERLRALKLVSMPDEKIVVRKMPWDTDIEPPYIIVSPPPETTNWQEGTNEKDVTVFAVLVSIVLANARDVTIKGMGLQLYWRERIRLKFQNKSPATWSELVLPSGWFFTHSWVESGDKFIEAAKRDQRDAQYYVIRVQVKEPRE